MLVEQGEQTGLVQRLGNVELMDEIGRTKIFQKRAMDEAVAVRADEAEDEVALPQMLDHDSRGGSRLREVQVGVQVVLDEAGQRLAVDHVSLQTAGTGLHEGRDATQQVVLFSPADVGAQAGKLG